jgi:hypothetical protein
MLPPGRGAARVAARAARVRGEDARGGRRMLGAPPNETVERLLARDGGGIVAIAFA